MSTRSLKLASITGFNIFFNVVIVSILEVLLSNLVIGTLSLFMPILVVKISYDLRSGFLVINNKFSQYSFRRQSLQLSAINAIL